MRNILVVVSEWGFWGEELVGPLEVFGQRGYNFSICTPHGKRPRALPPSMDPDFVDPPLGRSVTSAEMAEKVRAIDRSGNPQLKNPLDEPIDLSAWFPQRPYWSGLDDDGKLTDRTMVLRLWENYYRAKVVYTASATTSGGRRGRSVSSDGVLDVTLAAPKEMGGDGKGTNPEQLFAAGYSACFNSALMGVAKRAGVDASSATVTAHIGLGPDGDAYGITAELEVAIPGIDLAQSQQLTDAAHEVCPYSRAIAGNVPLVVRAVAA